MISAAESWWWSYTGVRVARPSQAPCTQLLTSVRGRICALYACCEREGGPAPYAEGPRSRCFSGTRQASNPRHPLWEFDLRPPTGPSTAGPTDAQGRCRTPPSGLVDVSVGCHRNSFGTGQTSIGSSGRSAHCHHVCRSAHRHNARQVRRPSSSRLESTRPPDSKGRRHSGQAGAALVMGRTLTE